jgi:hypothetical protein
LGGGWIGAGVEPVGVEGGAEHFDLGLSRLALGRTDVLEDVGGDESREHADDYDDDE